MRRSSFLLIPSILLLAGAASAGTLSVPQDFPTIQDAVTAAVPGDVIVVAKGSYRENVTITTGGITLKGKGVTIDGAYAGTCLTVQADDVTLRGLVFANGGPAAGIGGPAGGLDCTGTGMLIFECQARGCAGFGIQLTGSGTIENCRMSACLGPGLVIDTTNPSGPLTTLKRNKVLGCAAGITADDGPFLLDRNIVCKNTGVGIHITLTLMGTTTDGPLDLLTRLRRNKCLGNGGTGLLLDDGAGGVRLIEQNEIEDNGVGLDVSSSAAALVVRHNDVEGNRAGGVFFKVSGALFEGNRIAHNTLVGIVVAAAAGAPDGENTLSGNTFEGNCGDGIHVASSGNVISNNSMLNNTGDGLQVAGGVKATWLIENMVRDNGNDGIDNWGTGTLILDNTIRDSTGADLAGLGDGGGTVSSFSGNNMAEDGTGLTSTQELELHTLP